MTLQLIATFVAQLFIIRMVGVGSETDAYIAAQTLPTVIFSILSAALQSVWLPKLAVLDKNHTEWRHQQSFAQSQALVLGGTIYFLIWLTKEFWVELLFPGFTSNQIELTTLLIGPLLLAAAFNTHSLLLITALRAKGHFIVGELIPMLATFLSLFLLIILIPDYGIQSAAWIAEARSILVFLILYVVAGWPSIKFNFGASQIQTWKQLRPVLFGSTIYKTIPLVDRFWVSQAPIGGMTIFGLAQTMMGAITTIIEKMISMPLTPALARHVADNDYIGLKKLYLTGLKRVVISSLLVLGALMVIYPILLYLAIMVLKLTPETALTIWKMLILLIGYLYGAVSGSILVAVFYALGDMKTPMQIGLIGFLLGIILKSLGFILFGLYGLALSTSLYYLINSFYMLLRLEKKIAFRLS